MIEKKYEFQTAVPNEAGSCVSMIEYKGNILLACQFRIYQLTDDKEFKPIKFINEDSTHAE